MNNKITLPAKSRWLLIEPLEERQMLSVSPTEYDAIRAQYPDHNLSANMWDDNIIETTAEPLSDAAMRSAIGNTTNDLIVCRTATVTITETIVNPSTAPTNVMAQLVTGTNNITIEWQDYVNDPSNIEGYYIGWWTGRNTTDPEEIESIAYWGYVDGHNARSYTITGLVPDTSTVLF